MNRALRWLDTQTYLAALGDWSARLILAGAALLIIAAGFALMFLVAGWLGW